MNLDYLKASIEMYPHVPSFALWRAIELRLLSREHYRPPLLDLGCGDGSFSSLLFKNERIAAGIDINPEEIVKAEAAGLYNQALTMDGSRMDFPDNTFNAVFSNCVLEHVLKLKETLGETLRVLRPGGSLVFTVPSENFHAYLYHYKALVERRDIKGANRYIEAHDRRHVHLNLLGPDDWEGLLSDSGFKDIETEYYLPERTVSIWDMIEAIYTSEFHTVMGTDRLRAKCAALILTPSSIQKRLWYYCLRPYYLADVGGAEKGGALLIKCRKG